MTDIKQKVGKMFDERFSLFAGDSEPYVISPPFITNKILLEIKSFQDEIIDMAIAERDKEIVEMIKEYAEPYENSKWLNEINAQKIINLIINSNK